MLRADFIYLWLFSDADYYCDEGREIDCNSRGILRHLECVAEFDFDSGLFDSRHGNGDIDRLFFLRRCIVFYPVAFDKKA